MTNFPNMGATCGGLQVDVHNMRDCIRQTVNPNHSAKSHNVKKNGKNTNLQFGENPELNQKLTI